MDIPSEISLNLSKELASKKELIFIEALKQKGYEFNSIEELIEFTKNNIKASYDNERALFFVENKPFLSFALYSEINTFLEDGQLKILSEIKYTIL